jgi:hypothetical protein
LTASRPQGAPTSPQPTAQQFPENHLVAATVLLLHGVILAALMWWSWRKWPDPIVDFGRELYVPWQLTKGKVLYRDLTSLFGPLSPYLNAFWMRLFGVSLITLVWCNVAILAATTAAIHRLIYRCTDRFTATWATVMALALCGFSQYVGVGNYNFLTPYSHEATHGFALSILALLMMHEMMRTERRICAGAAGTAFGLSLLTKPELPIAAGGALLVGFICLVMTERSGDRPPLVLLAWFTIAALLPPTLFLAFFRAHLDLASAARAVAAGWLAAFNTAVVTDPFYRVGMGMDAPGRNAFLMCVTFLAIGCYIACIVLLSRTRAPSLVSMLRHLAILALFAVAPIAQVMQLGRALPLIVLTVVFMLAVQWWKRRHDHDRAMQIVGLLMWSTFALLLLAKIFLNARIAHYGFYLALPAVTVSIVLVCWLLPQYFDRWRVVEIRHNFRFLISIVLVASVLPHLVLASQWYSTKTLTIGFDRDRFYVSDLAGLPLDRLSPAVVAALRELAGPGDTVAVVPEGVMINYLLRLDSPLQVVNLMPPELVTFGETRVLRSLEVAPPTFVVFVHKPTAEYGYPLFGTRADYGQATMAWVRSRYRSIRVFGENPTSEGGYGLEIFRKL